jgi:hypothetical protein
MAEELAMLPEPYEFLELADKSSIRLRIQSYDYGLALIKPKYPGAPAQKEIKVLRFHMDRKDKPTAPHYWDFTASTAIASILPMLRANYHKTKVLVLTAQGVAPKKRFTVDWI